MNQPELINILAAKTDLSKRDVAKVIDALAGTVPAVLATGDDVRIFRLGIFSPQPHAAREGRNPRTGEKIHIAASTQAKFTAAQALVMGVRRHAAGSAAHL